MTDEQDLSGAAAAGREGLVTQMRELEAYIARAEASGETLPAGATELIERLRELVRALDGLTSSFGDE